MNEPDFARAEMLCARIIEITLDNEFPGDDQSILMELDELTSELKASDLATVPCGEFMTWAKMFFSHGKWRSLGARAVHDGMREKSHSIRIHVGMLKSATRGRPAIS